MGKDKKETPQGFFVIDETVAEELGKDLITELQKQPERIVTPPNLNGKKVYRITPELAQALIDWRLLGRPEDRKEPLKQSLIRGELTDEIQAMEAIAALRRSSSN